MPHVATMCRSILGYGGRSTSLSQSGLAVRPWPSSGRSETASLHQHWHVPTMWSEWRERQWSPHSHDLGGSRCAFRSFAGHRTTYASYTAGYARSRAYEQLSSAVRTCAVGRAVGVQCRVSVSACSYAGVYDATIFSRSVAATRASARRCRCRVAPRSMAKKEVVGGVFILSLSHTQPHHTTHERLERERALSLRAMGFSWARASSW